MAFFVFRCMMNSSPIGIFDSGLGGLSVYKAIRELLPEERVIYVADSGNCPYGNKLPEQIQLRSEIITNFLLSKDCKIIVVACNTATAHAIAFLRQKFDIPFIGMEPAIKPAAIKTKSGVLGVLATRGTFNGNHFKNTLDKYAKGVESLIQPGDGLVELVESGKEASNEAVELVRKYVQPMLDKGADCIVLGCTHYPFLLPVIKSITGNQVEIIDPAPAVARQTKFILEESGLLAVDQRLTENEFYTTGEIELLNNMLIKMGENLYITKFSPI